MKKSPGVLECGEKPPQTEPPLSEDSEDIEQARERLVPVLERLIAELDMPGGRLDRLVEELKVNKELGIVLRHAEDYPYEYDPPQAPEVADLARRVHRLMNWLPTTGAKDPKEIETEKQETKATLKKLKDRIQSAQEMGERNERVRNRLTEVMASLGKSGGIIDRHLKERAQKKKLD